jgi:4-amino-4-deoxy-L-arabinose transferase-like glycosyltransferase
MLVDPSRMVILGIFNSLFLVGIILFNKFIFPKRNINLFVLLILISLLPVISIFRIGTYQAGDLTAHTYYLQGFYENLKAGVFVPRWAGDFCGGYGCPIFIIEYILPFYIGSLFHFIGFSFLTSMKLVLAVSYILSGITMYLFIKDEYGKKPAFVSALLYLFAPIRFIEMHFRVSVGTDVAFIFIPLAFLLAKKSLEGKLIYIILYGINFLLLILSHSSVSLLVIPGTLLYVLFKQRNIKSLIYPLAGFLLGLGLSSFYVLPALFELKFTWFNSSLLTWLDFKPFLEYIYSPARYGLLYQGNHGELRLIVGYIHLFIILLATYLLFTKKLQKKEKGVVVFLLLYFLVGFIMMQSFTRPLWQNIFLLKSFILPWRILDILAFITAFIGAIITKKWSNINLIIFCVLIIIITILNWGNRKMIPFISSGYPNTSEIYSEYFDQHDPVYISRVKERMPELTTLSIYKPINHLQILTGKGHAKEISRTQIKHDYIVYANTNIQISENTYYFPGWKVYINKKEIPINIQNPKSFGTLTFNLKKGLYLVNASFEDTYIVKVGKYISFGTIFLILASILFNSYKRFASSIKFTTRKKK